MAKIMLVEDDNNLREIYGARLQAEGHEIVAARDGEEALALAVKEKPELIISDVMMPRISGFDMLDILRNAPETKNTKVIMMTALSQAEDKSRADKLGADRYLVKSQVTLEDVASVVSEVLNGPADPAAEPVVSSPAPAESQPAPTAAAPVTPEPAPAVAPAIPVPATTPAPVVAQSDPTTALPAEPPQSADPVTPPVTPEIIPVTAPPAAQPATDSTIVATDDTTNAAASTDNALQAVANELAQANLDSSQPPQTPEPAAQTTSAAPEGQPAPAIAVELPPQVDAAPTTPEQPAEPAPEPAQTNDLFAGSSLAEVLASEQEGSNGSLPSAALPAPAGANPVDTPAPQSPAASLPVVEPPATEELPPSNTTIQSSQSAIQAKPEEPVASEAEPEEDPTTSNNNSGMKVINPIGNPLATPNLDKLLADEERKLAVENPVANTVITPEKKSDELNNISL